MISTRKESLPSPSLEDSFFPFLSSTPSTRHHVLGMGMRQDDLLASPGGDSSQTMLEKDLILAAEVGRALLERNEEVEAQLEQMRKDMEVLQQEKHTLQRRLEVRELEAGQREVELQADITLLHEQLEQKHSQGRERRREENEQLSQLSKHNQKLVEQLAEAVSLEHSLRLELRSLREEMEDTSFSRSISSARLDSLQAENRVLQERCTNTDQRLTSAQEDNERLRTERDGLRERVIGLQTEMKERDAELDQEHSVVFQLRTANRSFQQRLQTLGDEASLKESTCFPMSLQNELQQSQAKETILAHSAALQEKEEEINKLKKELEASQAELEAVREELKPFRNPPGKPAYSTLENEIILARQERDTLNQQLLNTIKHKVALSQEVESWQEDMRLVICQQVQLQEREKEKEKEREKQQQPLHRGTRQTKSFRLPREESKRGFFSSLFGGE
ncbi:BICD family-like cargo adapter 2 [Electrophorus electricus]|uniref:BICD family-like cargo adapter 2 n=1 Tax=Electrophorus electricus TaxID=8005 RepID=A0A4W4GR13_ELEEL|nr:BICD family-like cargo adapter 2 [Electrophorus electricus]XP_026887625.2 BICD family-like cargo adapter 2 [Electrophorus electricus]